MHKKLLVMFFFAFAATNAYGLECFKLFWYGRRAEQAEAGQLYQQPPREFLIYTYRNDMQKSMTSLARIAVLKNYFATGVAEVIDDYLWMRCYIVQAHYEDNGVTSCVYIQDQDGIMHAYIVPDSRYKFFPSTWKMGMMTQKQMRDIVALREIQNKPFPANAAEQKAEDATLALLQAASDF